MYCKDRLGEFLQVTLRDGGRKLEGSKGDVIAGSPVRQAVLFLRVPNQRVTVLHGVYGLHQNIQKQVCVVFSLLGC